MMLIGCSTEETGRVQYEGLPSYEDIPGEGGSIRFNIIWDHAGWEVTEQSDNESFIRISPSTGGSKERSGNTLVTITVGRNTSESPRGTSIAIAPVSGSVQETAIIVPIRQGAGNPEDEKEEKPAVIIKATIDESVRHQVIDGFGGMNLLSNWGKTTLLTDAEVDKVFGTDKNQLGLSIMRIRLHPEKKRWNIAVPSARRAWEKYGVKILASPWSPPAYMKTNGSLIKGELKEDHYKDYALYLEEFSQYMIESGAPLYAVSIQNEPDWNPDYEGCTWTPEQVFTFVKEYGHIISSTRLAAAESLNMGHRYYDPLLDDEVCLENFDIVAGHIYGSGLKPYPLAQERGKMVWMTEHLLNEDYETDAWGESMAMVNEMNDCMTAGWNAYIWWYIKRYYSLIGDGDNGTAESMILPRGHAFAQFSRYIRPGYARIAASTKNVSGVKISAYTGENHTVIVLINNTKAEIRNFTIDCKRSIESATCTSRSMNGTDASVTCDGSHITLTLPAESISTICI